MGFKDQENLIDRENEIEKLSTIMDSCEKNNVILISGISGIGKSGLVSKLKLNNSLLSIIVSVKMTKNSVSTIENLQYFNAIYKCLYNFSIEHFSLIPTPTEYGIRSFGNIIRYIISHIKEKAGFGGAISIAEPVEDEAIIRKKDYIIYVLKNSEIILNIENIQNIDTQSFELLREIISSVQNKTFIFEYTLNETNHDHYINMYKEISETGCTINEFFVKKMDFRFAKTLAPNNKEINENLLKKIYDLSNGNLMEIILANEHSRENESNINVSLSQLSSNEKYIIYSVFLNDSSISYDVLYNIIANSVRTPLEFYIKNDESFLENIISVLCRKNLLKIENNKIYLIHDSISREIEKTKKEPILLSAYADVKEHFLNNLNDNSCDSDILEKLISLFIQFSDQELITILPNIKDFLLRIKYPHLIIKKLSNYRKSLLSTTTINKKSTQSLTLLLVEICLSKKLFIQAQENLDLIYNVNNSYHIALQGQIFALQDSSDIPAKIKHLVSYTDSGSRLKLILELCFLNYNMKNSETSKSRLIAENILKNNEYKKYKEYGYLLRNYAELLESTSECLKYYHDAIKIFKKHGMKSDIASVYISLSMIYSYEGHLKGARRYISKSINLDSNISMCYILNNKSVIDILDNTYSINTEKDLKDAHLLSVSKYERIIIECNLLVFYCLINDLVNAEVFAQRIENSDYFNYKYEEFLHIIYQDLLYYYNTINHKSKASFYLDKIIKLIDNKSTRQSTKELAKAMNELSTSDYFYSKFKFRVDFLGYWEFVIDNDISHY